MAVAPKRRRRRGRRRVFTDVHSNKIVNNLTIALKALTMKKIHSDISGSVWKVLVQAGQGVQAGDALLFVESMKMEIPVDAPAAGTVREVLVNEGEPVVEGQWLLTLD
jgi:acetyl-CoA carboxylase biotin carboxyl carrier protein